MKILDLDMKTVISETILCFAATINKDGSPNLSPKSTLKVLDDNHLIFANIASPKTIVNLKRDPRIEINCVDIFSRRGYRFRGKSSIHAVGSQIHTTLTDGVCNRRSNSVHTLVGKTDIVLIDH